jgi:hypothetical protein
LSRDTAIGQIVGGVSDGACQQTEQVPLAASEQKSVPIFKVLAKIGTDVFDIPVRKTWLRRSLAANSRGGLAPALVSRVGGYLVVTQTFRGI